MLRDIRESSLPKTSSDARRVTPKHLTNALEAQCPIGSSLRSLHCTRPESEAFSFERATRKVNWNEFK